jgi:hypothetical protein
LPLRLRWSRFRTLAWLFELRFLLFCVSIHLQILKAGERIIPTRKINRGAE